MWTQSLIGAFLVAQMVKISRVRKIPWRRDRLPTPVFLGFPGGSDGKQSACNAGDLGSVPGSGRSPGEGNGNCSRVLTWRIPWTELDITERLTLIIYKNLIADRHS